MACEASASYLLFASEFACIIRQLPSLAGVADAAGGWGRLRARVQRSHTGPERVGKRAARYDRGRILSRKGFTAAGASTVERSEHVSIRG